MPAEHRDPALEVRVVLQRLTLPWLLLLMPVGLVYMQYSGLPEQLPLLRDWSGNVEVWAQKSIITAFRVPLMGILMAAMVNVMWWQARRDPRRRRGAASAAFWLVLLYAAAVKSVFEGLQFVDGLLGPDYAEIARWSWIGTLVAVGGGLLIALIPGWRWLRVPSPLLRRLPLGAKLGLAALLILYAAFAFWPLMMS